MIIGNGMLAKSFAPFFSDDQETVVFASGVSDSQTTSLESYAREEKLLLNTFKNLKDKTLVYFSTCSIDEPKHQTMYTQHKLKLEKLIESKVPHYHIFRLSQVAGQSDKHIFFINYMMYNIMNKISFQVWKNTTRNVIDLDDVVKIVKYILDNKVMKNSVTNIASPYNMSVLEYVNIIEKQLNLKATYTLVDKGTPFSIDISKISEISSNSDVDFMTKSKYVTNIIEKYSKDIK